jgi:pimeloyl-ACP methyl ester carboxylesterase
MSTWILLRGLTREIRHWGDFPDRMFAAFPGDTVIALDLPGNGSLHAMESLPTVESMAAYCREELARHCVPPPYRVLAMSLGAMIAVAWASVHSEDIERCVLINTSMRPFSPFHHRLRPAAYVRLMKLMALGGEPLDWEATILKLTSNHPEDPDNVVKSWVAYRKEFAVTRRNAMRQLLAAARFNAPARKPACPFLVLASTRDALVNAACSRELAARWECPIVEHPTAGHDIALDDAPWLASQVGSWIAAQDALNSAAAQAPQPATTSQTT